MKRRPAETTRGLGLAPSQVGGAMCAVAGMCSQGGQGSLAHLVCAKRDPPIGRCTVRHMYCHCRTTVPHLDVSVAACSIRAHPRRFCSWLSDHVPIRR